MDRELWRRWEAAAGASPAAAQTGRDLLRRYAEPHRRYHDVEHLREVLAALDELAGGAAPPPAVVLAAFWHDAVYDPTAPDNERRSAALAGAALRDLAPGLADEVVRLVLLTVGHDPLPGDAPGALLCDADLAVLAAAPGRYRRYAEAVRAEYAHVGDDGFRNGRAAVLRGLLDRPALYRTAAGRRLEAPARRNVQDELDRLTAPGGGAAPPR